MNKPIVINMRGAHNKWLKLLLKLQNALPNAYRLILPDYESARKATHSITSTIERHPTWLKMVVTQRGCMIYLIKTDSIQDVHLVEE